MTFSKLILYVSLLLGSQDEGNSTAHTDQPLVQSVHLRVIELCSLNLTLTLQSVTDLFLEHSKLHITQTHVDAEETDCCSTCHYCTSRICCLPVAFMWMVAILSANTASEACMASCSAMSESTSFEARSSVKFFCSLSISSCTVRISSVRPLKKRFKKHTVIKIIFISKLTEVSFFFFFK